MTAQVNDTDAVPEAGRELDALVAERCMGLDVEMVAKAWTDRDWWCSDYPTEENVLAEINPNFERGGPNPPAWVIPAYSTEIGAAWAVVEKLRADGYATIHVSCGLDLHGAPIEGWYVSFFKSIEEPGGTARGATMQEAVCRCALKIPHPTTPSELRGPSDSREPEHDP